MEKPLEPVRITAITVEPRRRCRYFDGKAPSVRQVFDGLLLLIRQCCPVTR
jgi:hypothetical protein